MPRKPRKRKGCIFIGIALLLFSCALFRLIATSPLNQPATPLNITNTPDNNATITAIPIKRGWLCDYDFIEEIWLWADASMDANVKDLVGTCEGCCVDVTLLEQKSVENILFYRISVGGQSGWADVDYFYWSPPSWATNLEYIQP